MLDPVGSFYSGPFFFYAGFQAHAEGLDLGTGNATVGQSIAYTNEDYYSTRSYSSPSGAFYWVINSQDSEQYYGFVDYRVVDPTTENLVLANTFRAETGSFTDYSLMLPNGDLEIDMMGAIAAGSDIVYDQVLCRPDGTTFGYTFLNDEGYIGPLSFADDSVFIGDNYSGYTNDGGVDWTVTGEFMDCYSLANGPLFAAPNFSFLCSTPYGLLAQQRDPQFFALLPQASMLSRVDGHMVTSGLPVLNYQYDGFSSAYGIDSGHTATGYSAANMAPYPWSLTNTTQLIPISASDFYKVNANGSTTETARYVQGSLILPTLRVGGTYTGTLQAGRALETGGTMYFNHTDKHLALPPQVAIPAGSNSGNFSFGVDDRGINSSSVTVTHLDGSVTGPLNIQPYTFTLTSTPMRLFAGQSATVSVDLDEVAPAGGLKVYFLSDSASFPVPTSVTVPAGQQHAQFKTTAQVVNQTTPVVLRALRLGTAKALTLTVVKLLKSVTYTSPTVPGGFPITGQITLSQTAPSGGVSIALSSDNPLVTVPTSVFVPQGAVYAKFSTGILSTASPSVANITATFDGGTAQSTLNVIPIMNSLQFPYPHVIGGKTISGLLTLSVPAPQNVTFSVQSSSPLVNLASSSTIATGGTSRQLVFTTKSVSSPLDVNITVSFGKEKRVATITVIQYAISSLVFSPSTVTGGSTTTATVTLNGTAPSGGLVVKLASGSKYGPTPASVLVPQGASSASFQIATTAPLSPTQDKITATLGTSTVVATLIIET